MQKQATLRQHYVPQGFLRGFAAPNDQSRNLIWVYEKPAGRRPRKVSIRSIAWEPSYYAQEDKQGNPDLDTLEKAFATHIDQPAAELIRDLRPRPAEVIEFSQDEKSLLAVFIAISLTRIPSFREPMLKFHSRMAQMELDRLAEQDPKVKEGVEKWGVTAEAKEWVTLTPMVMIAQQIAQSLLQKNWQFSVPEGDVQLVTSDNPVLISTGLQRDPFMGPAHPGTEIVINLRRDLALVCTPKQGYPTGMVFSQSREDTQKFNLGIVRAARRFVFASFHSPEMDMLVKKYASEHQTIKVD